MPDRDPERLGDLDVAHPELVLQDEDGPLLQREAPEGPVDPLGLGESCGRVDGLVICQVDQRDLGAPPRLATFVIAGVDDHLAQPGLEPRRVAQARQLPPGADDRLLGRILGSVRVPEDQAGEREDPVRGGADERGEGVVVPPHRPLDLLDAHRVLGAPSAARIDDANSGPDGPCERETPPSVASDLTSGGAGRREPGGEGRSGGAAATIDPHGRGTIWET